MMLDWGRRRAAHHSRALAAYFLARLPTSVKATRRTEGAWPRRSAGGARGGARERLGGSLEACGWRGCGGGRQGAEICLGQKSTHRRLGRGV